MKPFVRRSIHFRNAMWWAKEALASNYGAKPPAPKLPYVARRYVGHSPFDGLLSSGRDETIEACFIDYPATVVRWSKPSVAV